MIELVRTWQVRESGNTTKVTSGQAWRCTKCGLHFQIKTQADAHKCGGAKENDG
jgi:transposase-like protein